MKRSPFTVNLVAEQERIEEVQSVACFNMIIMGWRRADIVFAYIMLPFPSQFFAHAVISVCASGNRDPIERGIQKDCRFPQKEGESEK